MTDLVPNPIPGFKCNSCDELFATTDDTEPLYECGQCGERFTKSNSADGDSNRCPSCNKFAAKETDLGCYECGDGELEETDLFECPECAELFEVEEECATHIQTEHPIPEE